MCLGFSFTAAGGLIAGDQIAAADMGAGLLPFMYPSMAMYPGMGLVPGMMPTVMPAMPSMPSK